MTSWQTSYPFHNDHLPGGPVASLISQRHRSRTSTDTLYERNTVHELPQDESNRFLADIMAHDLSDYHPRRRSRIMQATSISDDQRTFLDVVSESIPLLSRLGQWPFILGAVYCFVKLLAFDFYRGRDGYVFCFQFIGATIRHKNVGDCIQVYQVSCVILISVLHHACRTITDITLFMV